MALALNPSFGAQPLINVYPTKARLYVVGCNQAQTHFRILKIDRTELDELHIVDDGVVYTPKEIEHTLYQLDSSSRSGVLARKVSAFGIFGFVRFMGGFYIVLIKSRRRMALIGSHFIYRIEDTCLFPIPSSGLRTNDDPNEDKYLKMFQNVDLSSNFYFSYTYDLTRPLQNNMHVASQDEYMRRAAPAHVPLNPDPMFVWNHHLIQPLVERGAHPLWILPVIHGFIGQSNLSVYGRSLYVTLIARRSRMYAGTRFQKRGANARGFVANEVETEQIVHDATTLSAFAPMTSYIQMRGSVPAFWAQEFSTMNAKPPISITVRDPYFSTAALHFNRLMGKFGPGIIMLNLVKQKEKKPRESILAKELESMVEYLNQFVPGHARLRLLAWDMARCQKTKGANVLQRLEGIAASLMKHTGFFHSTPQLHCNTESSGPLAGGLDYDACGGKFRNQAGLVRVNCVDCLDRTNTAMFVLGLNALRHQLHALGVLAAPTPDHLPFDSDACRLLEELYEDHGDTIALQYGGSQLVNRIETYRKSAPWTSHSRDILNTVARYYSNSFTDAEKQSAINVFLGIFQPQSGERHLWDLDNDHFLHFPEYTQAGPVPRPKYTSWLTASIDTPSINTFRAGSSEELAVDTTEPAAEDSLVAFPEDPSADPSPEPHPDSPRPVRVAGDGTESVAGSVAGSVSAPVSVPGTPRRRKEEESATPYSSPEKIVATSVSSRSFRDGPDAPPTGVTGDLTKRLTVLTQLRGVDPATRTTQLRNDYVLIRMAVCGGDTNKFDLEVREMHRVWGLERAQPIDYVRSALLIAARENIILSPEVRVPRLPQPPLQGRAVSLLDEYYNRMHLTSFDELFSLHMTTTARLTYPATPPDSSPFKAHSAPRRRPQLGPAVKASGERDENDSDGGDQEDSISMASVDQYQYLTIGGEVPAPSTSALRVTLPTMKEVYGVSLEPASAATREALARAIDVGGLGASLMLRENPATCATSFLRGIRAAAEDPHVPSSVDPLGTLPCAALTTPPMHTPPPRLLPAPTHYTSSYVQPPLPTPYSSVSRESMAVYEAHVRAAVGITQTPRLNDYLAYIQAPLQVLDGLTR